MPGRISAKDKEELHSLDPSARLKYDLEEEDSSIVHAEKMFKALKEDIFYVKLRQIAWKEFCKQNANPTDVHAQVSSLLKHSGLRESLHTLTVNTAQQAPLVMRSHPLFGLKFAHSSADEPVECIRLARLHWERGINEELMAIASELKRPFLRMRGEHEVSPLLDTFPPPPADGVKFLFDSEDLLETGLGIQSPNAQGDRYMGLLKLHLPVVGLGEMVERYGELGCAEGQMGLDEGHLGGRVCAARHDLGEQVLQSGSLLEARLYLRRGVPPSLRARMWRRCLGLPQEYLPSEDVSYMRLRYECDRYDLLTDELYLHDVQTVVDDPRYFVFEEEMKEIIFCFSRDDSIRHSAHYLIHAPILGHLPPPLDPQQAMPPSAVQPYLGLAAYFAPLCYVYRVLPSLYSVTRALYCGFWCRLNVLSGDANTLLPVCKTFETVLMQLQPQLFLHLVGFGLQPLKIAFPWIQLAFVGLLEVDQVLLLWDRVIGFGDLSILALAAVGIFVDRMDPLMRCTSESEAALVLQEASRLKVVALLQMALFRDTRNA